MACRIIIGLSAVLLFHGCGSQSAASETVAAVKPDVQAIIANEQQTGLAAEDDGRNWPGYGRTYVEDHHSPLTQINDRNVSRLGLSAAIELPNVPGAGTTPIAVDGVIYVAYGPSVVKAVEAASGKVLWTYDPELYKEHAYGQRMSWGIRGLAYGFGKLFVGVADGRLLAIDASTGQLAWQVKTTEAGDKRYITGAPRVFRDMVVIGHGGADVALLRGYVTAYDARTGSRRWRFYTVPGDPAKGFENPAMKMAAATWKGELWKQGGGGTVWNAMAYDREQNLLLIGTGNGSPWNQRVRSPGGGDNLFLCSIVAIDADTGAYRWHYQVNPGESWDYNAAMDIELATLKIEGKPRKVLLHAPKNGFFYVIDRVTGKLISAEPFAKVNWATRIDLKTGRPVETADARYPNGPTAVMPGNVGAHSWQPMAYSPNSGLAYIPAIQLAGLYSDKTIDPKTWQAKDQTAVTAIDVVNGIPRASDGSSSLVAWNPATQKAAWTVKTPGIWNGGVMSTAGNLLFQGQADGKFNAYASDSGRKLWSVDAGLGISGAPISFESGGVQYIAVVAGWGGSGATFLGPLGSQHGWQARSRVHHLLIFRLGGKAAMPGQPAPQQTVPVDDPTLTLDPAKIALGEKTFNNTYCAGCHGFGVIAAGYAPDLRASPVRMSPSAFTSVVRGGALAERGMPIFPELTDAQLEGLREYIAARAREDLKAHR